MANRSGINEERQSRTVQAGAARRAPKESALFLVDDEYNPSIFFCTDEVAKSYQGITSVIDHSLPIPSNALEDGSEGCNDLDLLDFETNRFDALFYLAHELREDCIEKGLPIFNKENMTSIFIRVLNN